MRSLRFLLLLRYARMIVHDCNFVSSVIKIEEHVTCCMYLKLSKINNYFWLLAIETVIVDKLV